MSHAFFDRLNDLLDGLADLDEEAREAAEEMKVMIDLLDDRLRKSRRHVSSRDHDDQR